MSRNVALELVYVTEAAAIAAARWRGRGDKMAADRAASAAMRKVLSSVAINGTVRVGEGEMDECEADAMLYNGERLGRRHFDDPSIDIAVDPLEGTALCASNKPGAIATIAFAEDGYFLNAPDMYMRKIAVGPGANGAINLRRSWKWNLEAIAEAKMLLPSELTVAVLERDRHRDIYAAIKSVGARAHLFSDGDVMYAIATADPESGIDVMMGSGGAPEGVLAAAALRSLGGDMQAKLLPADDSQARRARKMTGRASSHIYTIEEMAHGNVMFAATGVTDSPALKGVRFGAGGTVTTHSLVTRSETGSVRWIKRTGSA